MTRPSEYAKRRLLAALERHSTTYAEAFECNQYGHLLRAWRGPLRRAIFRAMREPDTITGQRLSYPEIARACGMTSHTSVVEACAEKNRQRSTIPSR